MLLRSTRLGSTSRSHRRRRQTWRHFWQRSRLGNERPDSAGVDIRVTPDLLQRPIAPGRAIYPIRTPIGMAAIVRERHTPAPMVLRDLDSKRLCVFAPYRGRDRGLLSCTLLAASCPVHYLVCTYSCAPSVFCPPSSDRRPKLSHHLFVGLSR